MQLLLLLAFIVGSLAVKTDKRPVTYGSVVKLIHKETGFNLHSHNIAWGSGSGQQSVTTTGVRTDRGSLWLLKEASNAPSQEVGSPIKCGDKIRLEHADTGKNLHSHLFKAPLSGNQEVSGFGDGGNGDTGDNWQVVCETKDEFWMRTKPVVFQHVDTGKFLHTDEKFKFNQQNCGIQCPIMSQTEVSAAPKRDAKARWQTDQGLYFPSKRSGSKDDEDDEL